MHSSHSQIGFSPTASEPQILQTTIWNKEASDPYIQNQGSSDLPQLLKCP